MADPLQTLIRSLPACFDGRSAAEFCSTIANQVRSQANSLDNWWTRPIDWGEGTEIYSVEKVLTSANALDLFGQSLRNQSGPFCNASYEKNKLITMLGDLYGLVGARIAVNASLQATSDNQASELAKDLVQSSKDVIGGLADYSKWLVVGAVAVAAIILVTKYGGKNA